MLSVRPQWEPGVDMSRIAWNTAGSHIYEAGVDRGVLYLPETAGVPWIGLISVDENPTGGDAQPLYIDGVKYLNLAAAEEFEATIKAYTYPVEFSECDGSAQVRPGLFFSQQQRQYFSLCYRTMVGNEQEGTRLGYKLHLIYNAMATPSSRSLSTFSDSVEAADFSWSITTTPIWADGHMSTAHIVIDSRYTADYTLAAIENILYGTDDDVARIPDAEDLMDIFDTPLDFTVTDEGDGMFLVAGPTANVYSIGDNQFTIDHPSVTNVDADTSTITY